MKNSKKTKKLELKLDTLRTLRTTELRQVAGGITDSELLICANEPTAASSGPACCA